ncbi:hypothetical protein RRG08_063007 [Elysia crispata]|uniref:Secreted protein n=1 Tax=Elysia crispata TaxID=231223 RepID=A0AAE0YKJ2_9GAST|nr:hypothetical protein RRG08_063007 [Elysia crispata]
MKAFKGIDVVLLLCPVMRGQCSGVHTDVQPWKRPITLRLPCYHSYCPIAGLRHGNDLGGTIPVITTAPWTYRARSFGSKQLDMVLSLWRSIICSAHRHVSYQNCHGASDEGWFRCGDDAWGSTCFYCRQSPVIIE